MQYTGVFLFSEVGAQSCYCIVYVIIIYNCRVKIVPRTLRKIIRRLSQNVCLY